jgi:hypothetical protein
MIPTSVRAWPFAIIGLKAKKPLFKNCRLASTENGLAKFRLISPGDGKTLTFGNGSTADTAPRQHQHIHHVGTTGLITCVGIYFALDDHRCFLAHINAYKRGGPVSWREIRDLWRPVENEGLDYKKHVIDRLRFEAKEQRWPDHQTSKSRIFDSLLISCPSPEKTKGAMDRTGYWLIESIKEFLDAAADLEYARKWGFVVDSRHGKVEWLSGDEQAEKDELGCYRGVGDSGQVNYEGVQESVERKDSWECITDFGRWAFTG